MKMPCASLGNGAVVYERGLTESFVPQAGQTTLNCHGTPMGPSRQCHGRRQFDGSAVTGRWHDIAMAPPWVAMGRHELWACHVPWLCHYRCGVHR